MRPDEEGKAHSTYQSGPNQRETQNDDNSPDMHALLEGSFFNPKNIINLDKNMPSRSQKMGQMDQFNKMMQESKESFDRRFSQKSIPQKAAGRGIGMHLRQKDPLGSIAVSSNESFQALSSSKNNERRGTDVKTYFNN